MDNGRQWLSEFSGWKSYLAVFQCQYQHRSSWEAIAILYQGSINNISNNLTNYPFSVACLHTLDFDVLSALGKLFEDLWTITYVEPLADNLWMFLGELRQPIGINILGFNLRSIPISLQKDLRLALTLLRLKFVCVF